MTRDETIMQITTMIHLLHRQLLVHAHLIVNSIATTTKECCSSGTPPFALHCSVFITSAPPPPLQAHKQQPLTHPLHYSFFKTLVDTEVTVELKNDISIRGTLKSVDQYLNIKLDDISVVDELKYPHLVGGHRAS